MGELSGHSLFSLLAQTGRSFSGDKAASVDAQVLSLEGAGEPGCQSGAFSVGPAPKNWQTCDVPHSLAGRGRRHWVVSPPASRLLEPHF